MASNTNGTAVLQAKLNEPTTIAALTRLLNRIETLEAAVNRLADMMTQAPGMAAMVGDMVDDTVRSAADQGVDVDERLKLGLLLAERMTAPETVNKLINLLDMVEQAPGMMAMIGDMVDDTYRRASAHGVDIDSRLQSALTIAEKLTAPEMVAKLDQLLVMVDQAPMMAAMVGDMVDDIYRQAAASGIDIQERVKQGMAMVTKMTEPTTMNKLDEMFDVMIAAESGMLNPEAVKTLGETAQALVAARQEPIEKVGLFGALKALNQPEMQKALGFLLAFGKKFGQGL